MLQPHEMEVYCEETVRRLRTCTVGCELVLCPDFLSLARARSIVESSAVTLGAQDVFWEERGAYTGEISPQDLVSLGCRYVLIGHSERRQYLAETDEMVRKKIVAALVVGLVPIVCVGSAPLTQSRDSIPLVIEQQFARAFAGIHIGTQHELVIAYEPLWAIGSGYTETPEDVAQVLALIKTFLYEHLPGSFVQSRVRVLYGGSVSPSNARALFASGIHGFLVAHHARSPQLLAAFFPLFPASK